MDRVLLDSGRVRCSACVRRLNSYREDTEDTRSLLDWGPESASERSTTRESDPDESDISFISDDNEYEYTEPEILAILLRSLQAQGSANEDEDEDGDFGLEWGLGPASSGQRNRDMDSDSDDDEEDEIVVVDAILDKSLLTKHPLGNTRLPTSRTDKAALAAEIGSKLNEKVFVANHGDILNSDKYGADVIKDRLRNEKNFDTVAVSISPDGRKITIAGNLKKRFEWSMRFWHPTEYGLNEGHYKDAIVSALKEHFPELSNSKIDVVKPSRTPNTAHGNAEFHAEPQLLSFIGEVSDHPIGVNKPPCGKSFNILSEVGVISKRYERESFSGDKVVKNRITPNPEGSEHVLNDQTRKVTLDHNLHGRNEGFHEFVKGMAKVRKPAPVPSNADMKTKIKSHAKNHLNINVKPQVGISAGAGLENIINNITETEGRAHAEVLHASAGSYKTKCSTGLYARASTAEASASWNVFSASANGPAASAGLHSGVGTWAAAYANAEVVRAEAIAGPVSVGVGLNANTGASVGLDGANVSLLGFGASVGPKMSVKTPVADVSCCIM